MESSLMQGFALLVVTTSAILTFPISLVLLALYRRSVLRKMVERAQTGLGQFGAPTRGSVVSSKRAQSSGEPVQDGRLAQSDQSLYCGLIAAQWRAVTVYILGGVSFAVFMSIAFVVSMDAPIPQTALLTSLVFSWPGVIIVGLAVAHHWHKWARILLLYGLIFGLGNAVAIAQSPKYDIGQAVLLWVVFNLPPSLLSGALLTSRVRAVGPMVFTFIFFAIGGILGSLYYGYDLVLASRTTTGPSAMIVLFLDGFFQKALDAIGLGAFAVGLYTVGFILLGLLIIGGLGWLILRFLGMLYRRRAINGNSLVFDPIILIFGAWISTFMSSSNPWWILAGIAGFGVYKAATSVAFALAFPRGRGRTNPGISLVLLRVFALGKRSEQLYDAIEKHWCYIGPVQFITGPDLLTATVKPHNFLDYISGRLDRLFIASAEDLRRLAEGEHLPDRDGTYRNQDFFSYDNTWRMVLGRLAGQCQAILMDLRNFGPQHAGCRYEIQALIHNVALTKVVFIIDRTTKEALLSETLEAGWRDLPMTSPNRGMDPSQINLLRYEHSTDREFQQVLRALSHATVQHLATERGRAEQPKEGEGAEWQRGEQREENQNCREGPAQEKAPVRVEAEPATHAIWPDRGAMTELQATESFASEIPFERQLTPERVGGRQRRRGLSRPAVAWGVGALILLGAMCGCIILGSIDVVRSLSSNPTTTPQASINPPSMKNPDTIVELGTQPESLDPAWDDETGGGEILQNVYQPLVFYSREKTDQFVGVLASDWKTSLDGKTWTFAIRKGVRFANGDPMNPSDVAYSYLRGFTQGYVHGPQWVMLQPFFGASVTSGFLNPSVMPGDPKGDDVANTMYNGDFLAACQAAQKLIVADDTAGTVTMTLKQPWAPFLSSIAGTWASIIDKKWAIDLGDWDGTCATARQYNNPQYSSQTKLWNSTNGTGPYNVTRWDQGQRVRLDANPYYWQTQPLWAGGPSGAPQIQHVIVETVRRRDRQFSPATFAEADLASIPPTARDQIDPLVKEECGWDSATCTTVNPNGFLRVSKGLPGEQMGALFFNQNIKNVAGDANYRGSGKLGGNGIPPTFFANIHIRKAFVACFDHVTLIKQVFQGDGVHPSGPVIPGILSDDHGGPEQQFSLDTCKAEFDSAAKVPGYENLTDQGFVLPFAHLGGPDLVAGQNLAKNLAKINAKFRISFIESAPQFALSDQRRGALGLFYAEWREDYRAPHAWVTPFLASGGKYASAQAFDPVLQKQIDQLINEALGTADMNDRALIYAELYKLAFDNALDIFVVAPTNRHYEPTWMKGWYYNPILEGAPHAGYWYAYSKVAIR